MRLATEEDIESFAEDVREKFGERLERVILYGSYARDEHVPGSDIDIAVIVDEKHRGDRERLFDIADDYRDEGLDFSPRVFDKGEFSRKVDEGWSFHSEVMEEGVEI